MYVVSLHTESTDSVIMKTVNARGHGQVENADTVGRGRGRGRGHGVMGRTKTHYSAQNSFFSPLQCRTEAKHGYSFVKVACLAY